MTDSDAVWRRPADGADGGAAVVVPPSRPATPPASAEPYAGPPRAAPPPAGWRVPVVVDAAPPRELPEQDHAAIAAAERSAMTFSAGLGILLGAVMIVMMFVLLVRLIT